MANLETLELTISANAQSAVGGINNLIGSLTSLGSALQQPLRKLTQLNHQLKIMSGYGFKVSNVLGKSSKKTGMVGDPADYDPARMGNRAVDTSKLTFPNKKPDDQWQKEYEANLAADRAKRAKNLADARESRARIAAEQQAKQEETSRRFSAVQALTENASKVDMLRLKYDQMKQSLLEDAKAGNLSDKQIIDRVSQLRKLEEQLQKTGNEAEKTEHKTSKFGATLSQISRVAKMMIMRTAIRALIKGFSEAWQSAYKFSKSVGGEFAKNIDKLKGSLKSVAVNLISAFSPALSALVPVLNVVAGAIKYVCDLLKQLFSLLGVGNELFGASAEEISDYGNTGSGTAKEMLAAFDELNVINSPGGGGGGGGYDPSAMTDEVSDQLARLQVIVGEFLIPIGLLLAFTGHIGIGMALVAVGAAAIAKTIINDWGKITQDTKDEIATIMAAAGGAFLAIGLLLAFTGHVGIGIALMAVGAANLATVAIISDSLSQDVKDKIQQIEAIAGAALLVLGIILCFTGAAIPLGLGMMAAGGISLAAAIAPNWNALINELKSVFEPVVSWLKGKWESVTTAVSNAWTAVCKWWDSSIAKPVETAWKSVSTFFGTLFGDSSTEGSIAKIASSAWDSVSSWWDTNIASNFSDAWDDVSTYFGDLFSDIEDISDVWDIIGGWTGVEWSDIEDGWAGVKKGLSEMWGDIGNSVSNAWKSVKNWTSAKWSDLSSAWGDIKSGITGVWSDIKTGVSNAWSKFSDWKAAKWSDISSGWEEIKTNLSNAWDNVKTNISSAWDKFQNWKDAKWSDISSAWGDIKSGLANYWSDIKSSITLAWNRFSDWKNSKWADLSSDWTEIKNKLSEVWSNVKDKVVEAWNKFSNWKSAKWADISSAWGDIKSGLCNIWGDVKNSVILAWNRFANWKSSTWDDLSGNWTTIKKNLASVWSYVRNTINSAWTKLEKWTGATWDDFKSKWTNIKIGFQGIWSNIYNNIIKAWNKVVSWKNARWGDFSEAWDAIKTNLSTVWDTVCNKVSNAWTAAKQWWTTSDLGKKVWNNWVKAKQNLETVWSAVATAASNAWDNVCAFWNTNIVSKVKEAWGSISEWFQKNVTSPISNAWSGVTNFIKNAINSVIGALNSIGSFTIPRITMWVPILGTIVLTEKKTITLWNIPKLASGAYDIPSGQLFIANEAGAEMVGSMDGKTTVANQNQIVEGIRKGVHDANSDQNAILREQNALLRAILQKESTVKLSASSALGRTVKQSLTMYGTLTGG